MSFDGGAVCRIPEPCDSRQRLRCCNDFRPALASPAFHCQRNADGSTTLLLRKKNTAAFAFYSGTGAPTPGGSVDSLSQALAAGYYGNAANAGIDSDAPQDRSDVTPAGQASPGPKVGGVNWAPGAFLGHAITCNGPEAVPNVD